ncbi:hypothetical protein H5410_057100 [Solanum commersonii]|uniref:Uncharacterized protein n=1 Tax=Solanum commersonii TaxID=4109 RepID=A0A9J5WPX9_SOLCO|nr:hypothetical protein H5410_057100 [Solanum commersonii]
MAQEIGFEEEVVVDYDQYRFVSLLEQEIYYADLMKKKLLSERGISLDKENEKWVREFYANLMKIDMESKFITILGMFVDYRPEAINWVYGLLNHDIKAFTDK